MDDYNIASLGITESICGFDHDQSLTVFQTGQHAVAIDDAALNSGLKDEEYN
jgi:hypothetical protein